MNDPVTVLLGAVGFAMLLAGPILVISGAIGRRQIRRELTDQKISFPEAERLPARLARYAGRSVTTGPQAKAFSEVIANNVHKMTGGRTYSEISAELHAAGGEDEELIELRQLTFMGQTLRASMLTAYQAWALASLVIVLGVLLTGAGCAFLALGATLSTP